MWTSRIKYNKWNWCCVKTWPLRGDDMQYENCGTQLDRSQRFKDYLMVIIVGLGRSKPRKMKARVIAVLEKESSKCAKISENCNNRKQMWNTWARAVRWPGTTAMLWRGETSPGKNFVYFYFAFLGGVQLRWYITRIGPRATGKTQWRKKST